MNNQFWSKKAHETKYLEIECVFRMLIILFRNDAFSFEISIKNLKNISSSRFSYKCVVSLDNGILWFFMFMDFWLNKLNSSKCLLYFYTLFLNSFILNSVGNLSFMCHNVGVKVSEFLTVFFHWNFWWFFPGFCAVFFTRFL